jgi:hypothetical protein
MPIPILFSDTCDEFEAEYLERGFATLLAQVRAAKKLKQARAHQRWKRHWRTLLSRFLRCIAAQIELPEPEEPV